MGLAACTRREWSERSVARSHHFSPFSNSIISGENTCSVFCIVLFILSEQFEVLVHLGENVQKIPSDCECRSDEMENSPKNKIQKSEHSRKSKCVLSINWCKNRQKHHFDGLNETIHRKFNSDNCVQCESGTKFQTHAHIETPIKFKLYGSAAGLNLYSHYHSVCVCGRCRLCGEKEREFSMLHEQWTVNMDAAFVPSAHTSEWTERVVLFINYFSKIYPDLKRANLK